MFQGLAILLLLASSAAGAQSEQGSIVGRVRDHKSLEPVPSASVEIRSLSTNVVRQVTVSAAGEFDSLPLPPGRYAVSVRDHAFHGHVEKRLDVIISAGQRLELNFELEKHTLTGPVVLGILTLLAWLGYLRMSAAWTRRLVLATAIIASIAFLFRLYWSLAPHP